MGSVASTASRTLILYFVLWVVGAICSLDIRVSAAFSIGQILLLLSDIEYADKANRLLQNFTAAVVNGGVGWLVGDHLAYAGGIAVGAIVVLKALDKLKL